MKLTNSVYVSDSDENISEDDHLSGSDRDLASIFTQAAKLVSKRSLGKIPPGLSINVSTAPTVPFSKESSFVIQKPSDKGIVQCF
jgi:hypothetical protein